MEEITYKNINAEDFARLDFSKVTLVDLREPDDLFEEEGVDPQNDEL